MKKQLYELTVEEFTRLLLDNEKIYNLELSIYESKQKITLKIIGTYNQIYEQIMLTDPRFESLFKNEYFDYDLEIGELEAYNYIQHKTDNFSLNKVCILISEILSHLRRYTEEIRINLFEFYTKNNLEVPYRGVVNKPRYDVMKKKVFPGRERKIRYILAHLFDIKDSKLSDKEKEDRIKYRITDDLDTPEAVEIFKIAENKGFMSKYKEGYKWKKSKRLLAYFIEKANDYLEFKTLLSDRKNMIPFKILFGYDLDDISIEQAKVDCKKDFGGDFTPIGYSDIDDLFNDLSTK